MESIADTPYDIVHQTHAWVVSSRLISVSPNPICNPVHLLCRAFLDPYLQYDRFSDGAGGFAMEEFQDAKDVVMSLSKEYEACERADYVSHCRDKGHSALHDACMNLNVSGIRLPDGKRNENKASPAQH